MKCPIETIPVQPCTNTIYRPFGGIDGFRQIRDPAGRMAVTAFPLAMARSLAATIDLWSACYVILGQGKAYVGESNRAVSCVAEHASDPAKAYAKEVYLLHAQEPHRLYWSARLHIAHRLTELAKEAGLVTLANTVEPRVLPCALTRAATLERLVTEGRRLLFDAGCRILDQACEQPVEVETAPKADGEETLELGSAMTPLPDGKVELELDYCGIWARGYQNPEGFVVKAGSQLRAAQNPSLRKNIKAIRADLLARGIVVPIPGLKDRLRLRLDWRFFSAAVAAKFVTGAHVAATKWVCPRHPGPIARAE